MRVIEGQIGVGNTSMGAFLSGEFNTYAQLLENMLEPSINSRDSTGTICFGTSSTMYYLKLNLTLRVIHFIRKRACGSSQPHQTGNE